MRNTYSWTRDLNLIRWPVTRCLTARYDKRGNLLERIYYNEYGSIKKRLICTYDEEGNLLEKKEVDAKGSLLSREVKSYDSRGRMTSETAYDKGGRFSYSWFSKYNDKGNVLEKTIYHVPDLLAYRQIYAYDEKGKLQQIVHSGRDGKTRQRVIYRYNHSERLIGEFRQQADGTIFDIKANIYDGAGNLIKEISRSKSRWEETKYYHTVDIDGKKREVNERLEYDSAGSLIERYVSTYDKNGNEIKWEHFDASNKRTLRDINTFDSQGNMVRKVGEYFEPDGSVSGKTVVTYDSKGSLTNQITYDADGSVSWDYRLDFTYDVFGNWIVNYDTGPAQ